MTETIPGRLEEAIYATAGPSCLKGELRPATKTALSQWSSHDGRD